MHVDPDDLTERLAEVERVRALTRQSILTLGWGILILWGVAFLASVPVAFVADGDLGGYWIVAAPLAAAVSFVAGSRQELHTTDSAWPYLGVGAFMFVGAFGSFVVFEGHTAIVVWWGVLVSGFGALAWLDRQRAVAIADALLLVWGLVLWVVVGDDHAVLYAAFATGLGAFLVGVGTALAMFRR